MTTGFDFVYLSDCENNLSIPINDSIIIKSPNYPNGYTRYDSCTWIIRAASKTSILVEFLDFKLQYDDQFYIDMGDNSSVVSSLYFTWHDYIYKQEAAFIANFSIPSDVMWISFEPPDDPYFGYVPSDGFSLKLSDINATFPPSCSGQLFQCVDDPFVCVPGKCDGVPSCISDKSDEFGLHCRKYPNVKD